MTRDAEVILDEYLKSKQNVEKPELRISHSPPDSIKIQRETRAKIWREFLAIRLVTEPEIMKSASPMLTRMAWEMGEVS